ncbi:alpha/beta hydrolase [Flavobacterium hydrophilum]|uniref:Alpha/beta hydrolase n=1 Tax=Flavobacterium hydrophilum TaxID=2211445 RepID=A0A2V4CHD8_9FLAO|nr:alpha/beta hydrolase [Flavobacterium hydrophilum]PXY45384.1 alpha/beta hydrolase [Flavobacterium hydrophilum]
MVKPKLLILSDLFGGENPDWIQYYIDELQSKFDIQYYDVRELANISLECIIESDLHNQFLNGGIEKAVKNLLKIEKEETLVLGFSIGGFIAWKAALKGLKVSHLIAVSSTRLRFETEVPNCKINLYFGQKDVNVPNTEWFSDLNISSHFFENQGHQFYLQKENAFIICNNFL